MSLSIRPLALTDREELAALVEANLPALERGLSILERRFPAGQVPVDLVAVDARKRLVLLILGSGSNPAMLLQGLEAYAWCRENGALLGRLLPDARIDPAAPPRLFLLAPRFSDSLRRTARYLGPVSPVLVECRCLEVNGERGICFEPVEASFFELREKLKNHRQVHCHHLALGASDSTGNMVHRGSSDMFFLAKTEKESSQYKPDELEKVEIQTLDHFCRDHGINKISYLKIDTEGNDLEVLKGAENMLQEQRIDLVEVEAGMHPGNTRHVPFEVLKKHLEQRQYFVFALYEQMYEWSENAPHLRRTNPVFISRRAIEANKKTNNRHG